MSTGDYIYDSFITDTSSTITWPSITSTGTSTYGIITTTSNGSWYFATTPPTPKDIEIQKLNGYFNPNALGVFYKGSLRLV